MELFHLSLFVPSDQVTVLSEELKPPEAAGGDERQEDLQRASRDTTVQRQEQRPGAGGGGEDGEEGRRGRRGGGEEGEEFVQLYILLHFLSATLSCWLVVNDVTGGGGGRFTPR